MTPSRFVQIRERNQTPNGKRFPALFCVRAIISKKRVDYSQFGLGEDDDDFAEFTPQTSKRQKTSTKDTCNKAEDKAAGRKIPKSRPSIDDKVYERELQAALELSMNESQPSKPEDTNEKENVREIDDNVKDIAKDVKMKPGEVKTIVTKAVISPNKDSEDEIVVLETDVEENPKPTGRTTRRAAVKAVVIDDDGSDAGSDFALDEEENEDDDDDSDDDFNEEDYDSDFNDKKSKKTKTKEKENSKKEPVSKAKTGVSKSAPKTKATTKTTQALCKTPVAGGSGLKKPSVVRSTPQSTVSSSIGSPVPRWNPPGPAVNKTPTNSDVPLKSPSSGLRVGLSRNMKLKPLHPNMKIKH